MNSTALPLRVVAVFTLALAFAPLALRGAETNALPGTAGRAEETNSLETLRAYLQLQEQLHAAQLAIEQNRKDAREAAAQNADALASRLQTIEQVLVSQRARELDTMQSSNRIMVIVAGSFAAVGFVAMMLMAYFQWRTINGLAEISAALPVARALGTGSALAALGPGDTHMVGPGPAEQSNLRLLGAMEQLEKRLFDLEHTAPQPSKEGSPAPTRIAPANGNGEPEASANGTSPRDSAEPAPATDAERVAMLLGKGQSMLNLDKPDAALACFDEALILSPGHTEALVKKGTALERLQKLNEAIECYDQAIAADGSMTIAYLHKGGLFNRMERFNEALECYEKALQTQEKRQD